MKSNRYLFTSLDKICLPRPLFLISTLFMVLWVFSGCLSQTTRPDNSSPHVSEIRHSGSFSDPADPCSYSIPKTGQTLKWMTGDDGDLKAGEPWPVARFKNNGDGTVTDNLTGLMWTRNANQKDGPADWEQAVSGAVDCTQGGFRDWRLPNRRELESLLDLGQYNPALPAGHPFTGVQSDYYWTSTTTANGEDNAWLIHYYIGFMAKDDKAGSHYVWYVRGGPQGGGGLQSLNIVRGHSNQK